MRQATLQIIAVSAIALLHHTGAAPRPVVLEVSIPIAEARLAADEALEISPPSVTDNATVPPSGDRHDYMSLAPYWWPDPSEPDGEPYIRKDGRRNPESASPRVSDHGAFGGSSAPSATSLPGMQPLPTTATPGGPPSSSAPGSSPPKRG